MSKVDVALEKPPQFTIGTDGRPTAVMMGTVAYVKLLIRANIIDRSLWPPGMEHAADVLARIRQIESDCIKQYGQFDWEKLSEALQDEYDSLCVLLDSLHDDGNYITWEAYKEKIRGTNK